MFMRSTGLRPARGSKHADHVQVMIGHYSNCSGKIEAPDLSPHRDPVTGKGQAYLIWKPRGFSPEQQIGSMVHPRLGIVLGGKFAESKDLSFCLFSSNPQERLKTLVVYHVDFRPVIKARPLEMPVIDSKPERMYEVEPQLCCPAKTCNIAGVRRDLRLVKDHVQCRGSYSPMLDVFDAEGH